MQLVSPADGKSPTRAMLSRGRIGAALLALALLAGLVLALRPRPVEVDLAAVTRGPMRVTVDEEGKTRIKQVYLVSAPVTGKLRRSLLDPGDPVEKDRTVLAVIEPTAPGFLDARTRRETEAQVAAARAAVALAEAEVRQAETELQWAQSELERTRTLAQSSTVSQRAFERARLDLAKQQAGLARARASLELRRSELATASAHLIGPESSVEMPEACCVEVRSPQSGQVLRELQESEKVVTAGAPLFEIGNPADLDVVVELLSTDAVRIAPGAEATIEGAGLAEPLAARVRRIEPAGFTKVSALGIEEQRVRVLLDLASPAEAWARLGHDYRITARITRWSSAEALRVPLSALYRRGERWAVYKAVGGRAAEALVEIGQRNSAHAEVLGGLAVGDEVILHPSDRIAQGVRLRRRIGTAP